MVEWVCTDGGGSAVCVHFNLPTDVASAVGLELRIEQEAGGRGCLLVLSGVPGCETQRVPLECEVDEDSVRAKFKVRLLPPLHHTSLHAVAFRAFARPFAALPVVMALVAGV